MKLGLVEHLKRNMAAAALNSLMKLFFPFLNRTLFLWVMGPAYLGLNGLFWSILGVLSLAELGFGTAVVSAMYKPVADDNRKLLCAYLCFYRTLYRWVGAAIFVVGLCLLPFLRYLVHGSVPADVNLHVLYVIHLTNTAVSYFLFSYRGAVLKAYHRNDVENNIRTGVSAAQYLAGFAILWLTRNYYGYVLCTVFFTVVQNLLILRHSQRLFPEILPEGDLSDSLRSKIKEDVTFIFMHRVGGAITGSMGNLLISAFLGLVAVAAYGNYYYVVTAAGGVVWVAYHSMNSGFGNCINTESREKSFEIFIKFNRLVGIVILWCAAMMAALYQPFLHEWTRCVRGGMERHFLTAILMVLYFYLLQSRQVLLSIKSSARLWRPDCWKPIVAGAANLLLSSLFIIHLPEPYKLDGVIFSSVLTMGAIQFPWEAYVVFTNLFDRKQARIYLRSEAELFGLAVLLCASTWGVAALIPKSGFTGVIIKAVAAAVFAGGLLAAYFRQDMLDVLKKVFPGLLGGREIPHKM
ncbi:MAG: hypothetical protein IJT50_16725 [Lentisphaeria bacterium]|nr:hypothetical protein [Lentisphaeria bacterium]